jgi:hypothetical protein
MLLVEARTVDETVRTATNVAETELVYDPGTSYSAGDRRRPTGSGANTHRLFESVADSNLGNDPLADDGSNWIDVGYTNAWRMYHGSPATQTTNADSIAETLQIAGRADVFAVQNVSAASLTLTATDDEDGVVYTHTEALIDDSGCDNWLSYWTLPIIRKTDVTLTDLPKTYSDLVLDVTLEASGETVACGLMIVGQSNDLGGTRWGGQVSIRDFSTKDADDLGGFLVVERTFAKRGQFDAVMRGSQGENAARILAKFRATPVLLVGAAAHPSTVIWGFIRDWTLEKVTRGLDNLSLEFEGLTE